MPLNPIDEITGLATQQLVFEPTPNEIVIQAEVFKNYIAIITEKNKERHLKTVNLKTGTISTHYFDSVQEVNPSDKRRPEFFEASFIDNYTFDSNTVRYELKTPVTPTRAMLYNMATKKVNYVGADHIKNMPDSLTCEKIEATMRDGEQVDIVMLYD